jgi:hypothetical protein
MSFILIAVGPAEAILLSFKDRGRDKANPQAVTDRSAGRNSEDRLLSNAYADRVNMDRWQSAVGPRARSD